MSDIYTHNGWFSFCPVKIGYTFSAAPMLAPRWVILEPLFRLAEMWQQFGIFAYTFMGGKGPVFAIKVTGERKP